MFTCNATFDKAGSFGFGTKPTDLQKHIFENVGKSPPQHFDGIFSVSSSKPKTNTTRMKCGHNLVSVTQKVPNHHVHH